MHPCGRFSLRLRACTRLVGLSRPKDCATFQTEVVQHHQQKRRFHDHVLTGFPYGRFSNERASSRDGQFIKKQFNNPNSFFLPFFGDSVGVNTLPSSSSSLSLHFCQSSALAKYFVYDNGTNTNTNTDKKDSLPHNVTFLGALDHVPYFAVDITPFNHHNNNSSSSHDENGNGNSTDISCSWRSLKPMLLHLEGEQAAIAGRAWHTIQWHRSCRYCSSCGSRSSPVEGDGANSRRCDNDMCRKTTWPPVSPVIIVAVHDGFGNIFLARQKHFLKNAYSVLAGFVEPGESLEECVAREVFEETGLTIPITTSDRPLTSFISDSSQLMPQQSSSSSSSSSSFSFASSSSSSLVYHSSQPWPFPHSLMIGWLANLNATKNSTPKPNFILDKNELEDGGWYSSSSVLSMASSWRDDRLKRLSSPASISHHLAVAAAKLYEK